MASVLETGRFDLELFVTEGLGDNTYLLASGDEAALVDPQRDVDRFLKSAERRGLRVRHVLETHVHNDYVTGALEVRERTGAAIGAPARGRYAFPHRGLSEGEEIGLGDLRILAIETPGHTPEHLTYLVFGPQDEEPAAAFTGGSLLVGSAGRTDLLGDELTEDLARAQFRSLRRLAELPDGMQVLPTHGGGSFCVASRPGGDRTSTMAAERAGNRALAETDEEAYVRSQRSGMLAFPSYYRHMAGINRAGPRPVEEIEAVPALSPEQVAGLVGAGTWIVDGRPRDAFAGAHLPGSLSIELNPLFASYVGWLVPFGAPIVLVLPSPDDLDEAVTHLLRIGFEDIRGYLAGGIDAWRDAGHPASSFGVATIDDLCRATREGAPMTILDVRQAAERARNAISGSLHVFVGDLPRRLDEIPRDREVWAICASGHRSAMAASVLDREGIRTRLVTPGGVREYVAACGGP
jgi:hydroxyacylglutathione hydrolase